MVSFVPPLPGTSDGGEKRTLPNGTLIRTDHRQSGGTVERSTTFIVKTMLSAAPVFGLLIGSAIETEVMSCDFCASVSSPTGSETAVMPCWLQEPVNSMRGVTESSRGLLGKPVPA